MNVKSLHGIESQSAHLATSERMSEVEPWQSSPRVAPDGVRSDSASLARGRKSTLSQAFRVADKGLGPSSVQALLAFARPLHRELARLRAAACEVYDFNEKPRAVIGFRARPAAPGDVCPLPIATGRRLSAGGAP